MVASGFSKPEGSMLRAGTGALLRVNQLRMDILFFLPPRTSAVRAALTDFARAMHRSNGMAAMEHGCRNGKFRARTALPASLGQATPLSPAKSWANAGERLKYRPLRNSLAVSPPEQAPAYAPGAGAALRWWRCGGADCSCAWPAPRRQPWRRSGRQPVVGC